MACWSKRSACNVALLRADSTGSLLGHWVIPTGYNTRVETLLPATGGFLAGGTAETGGGSDLEAFVWRVSSEGERVWELVRGGTGDEEVASMVLAADGRVVLVGTTTSTGGGDADIWLLGLERLQEGVIADDR